MTIAKTFMRDHFLYGQLHMRKSAESEIKIIIIDRPRKNKQNNPIGY